jgi:hypothetical protein
MFDHPFPNSQKSECQRLALSRPSLSAASSFSERAFDRVVLGTWLLLDRLNAQIMGANRSKHGSVAKVDDRENFTQAFIVAENQLRHERNPGQACLDRDAFRSKGAIRAGEQGILLTLAPRGSSVESCRGKHRSDADFPDGDASMIVGDGGDALRADRGRKRTRWQFAARRHYNRLAGRGVRRGCARGNLARLTRRLCVQRTRAESKSEGKNARPTSDVH